MAVSTGNGNCLFNSLSIGLSGTENYATECRVKTCINLVLHLDSVASSAIYQRCERTCNKRTESVWASVANECGCQGENFAATRIIQPFELQILLKNDALKMANDFPWACYYWVFTAATALKIDIFCVKPKGRHSILAQCEEGVMYDITLFWNGKHFSSIAMDQPTALTLLSLIHFIERPFHQFKSKKAVVLACLCLKVADLACYQLREILPVEAENTARDPVASSATTAPNANTSLMGGLTKKSIVDDGEKRVFTIVSEMFSAEVKKEDFSTSDCPQDG